MIYVEPNYITKLETIHMVTGRMVASYEYVYNEEGYIVKEIVKETVVSQWFEEIYDLFLDTILSGFDIDDYDGIKQAWKKFYDAHHIFCDHGDADGDGQYDNCLWSYMTATSTYEYRYDENWQLTKCTETLQNGIITEYDYQYDKDGNRSKYVKTVNGEWTECYTYEYNSANQLISRTNQRQWTDNVTYYSYDADGNLITEQTGHHKTSYEYTAENRLAVVKEQGTVLMAALYDGDGNRLFTMDYTGENNDRWDIWIPECGGNADQVDDSAKDAMKDLASLVSRKDRKDYTITEYVNDVTRENEEVLAELNHRGKVTTAYTYGYTRESADTGYDTQYYLYDGQGNVSRISSEWGRVKETYSYDPYGNLTYGIPDTVNYYGYNGESSNLATGLQYLRARYYNPQTGSFITEDTYAGQISNPLTLNRYDYVSNNPVNRIDPNGHSWLNDAWNGAKKLASDAWNGFTYFVGELGDSYMRGQELYQQTQLQEQQLVTNLITGKYNQSSNKNQLQKDLEANVQKKQSGSEDKDKNILEKMGEGFLKLAQMNYAVEEQQRQLEQEQRRAFCEYLETKEGQQTAAAVIGIGVSLAVAPFVAPALVGYLNITTTAGAVMITAGTYSGIAVGTTSLINSATEGNSAGRVFTDTLQGTIGGFIPGMAAGAVDYGASKLFGMIKGTTAYQSISKHLGKLFGIVDDADNVKIPIEGGSNSTTDDIVEDIIEGGTSSKRNTLSDNDSVIGHIFRDAEGHVPDTPENRALLEDVANNLDNFQGTDKYGNEWYTMILEDGRQVWVESRNGSIFEGGINEIPKLWNPETGLKKP